MYTFGRRGEQQWLSDDPISCMLVGCTLGTCHHNPFKNWDSCQVGPWHHIEWAIWLNLKWCPYIDLKMTCSVLTFRCSNHNQGQNMTKQYHLMVINIWHTIKFKKHCFDWKWLIMVPSRHLFQSSSRLLPGGLYRYSGDVHPIHDWLPCNYKKILL